MASLRVSLPTVTMIAQEILSLYMLWFNAVPESGLGQSAVGDSAGDVFVTPACLTTLAAHV